MREQHPPREPHTPADDKRLEGFLGHLLRIGVMLAAAVCLMGGVLYLVRHGQERPSYGAFRAEPAYLRSVPGILRGAATLNARSVIQLGLLLLVATPVARVVASAVAFAVERDYLYVVVTALVLALLLLGLTGYAA